MPTYQYACNDCGEQLEVVQKFTDDALTICPACEGNLRKVFSAVGIVFKGSGFYRTDNRSSSTSTSTASSSSSSSKPAESKSADTSTSTPAAAPAAASN
ncbi:FmdB family zinc ribbon protein [Nonomuraea angiospora]|uniref:FmdB family regulatory protein n=1 Tax=Nonomuraea angiospora TaxID=46172 RepID=A0ABR9M6B6_9ACTN|nr:FmdB family zinc ribbon protein [Nonomuraea angiospora]MBE1587846.1 putative FmdB family regulatory protein [Nonomuraea angiospora]MDX3104953.1 zinc ribbon domain-containing protein [Nonomuraea angiospora]